ncbi:BatA domain-containing protein [Tenacibaculum sp. TC6]|uniref:BatA domain-containing protein n=1 Tax=Tenacibaculum sp. TC6 TaxID=3423223 RepID=UPI003D36CA69
MQFKYPEILYFLALLVIPILVHLFQLQRFVKVPFTNVAFLQKLALQTRKSSRIKKWLILATRLLLLTFLILAFAQPYFSTHKADEQQHYFIYLDNSLSTKTQGNKGDLLQVAAQELAENLSDKASYSLQTNTNFYRNKTASELKEVLLQIENTAEQKSLKDIILKAAAENTGEASIEKNIIISDFQNVSAKDIEGFSKETSFVQLTPQVKENMSIDSVSVNDKGSGNLEIHIQVKNQGTAKTNVPIAIYNDQKLINKQTFDIAENSTQEVVFSVQRVPVFLGRLVLTVNDAFSFDNSFFFTVTTNEKINILAIGKPAPFLTKIYTNDEFSLSQSSAQNINYNSIPKQQLIILNELETLPQTLITALTDFTAKGGNILIIPAVNSTVTSYNLLFKNLNTGPLSSQKTDSLKVTGINFKHPIFEQVFEKNVSNFQYPSVASSYTSAFKNASTILSFENKKDFISEIQLPNAKVFWVAGALNKQNSNFTNSPLIVPVFYNIGKQSLQLPQLYYTVNNTNTIDIHKELGKEAVLTISNAFTSFIPLQQVYQNKVRITTTQQPEKAGFNYILQQKDTLKQVAFNYHKSESMLQYLSWQETVNQQEKGTISTSVKATLEGIRKKNEVQWLWKWFLALSIVSLLLEILILKFFKP